MSILLPSLYAATVVLYLWADGKALLRDIIATVVSGCILMWAALVATVAAAFLILLTVAGPFLRLLFGASTTEICNLVMPRLTNLMVFPGMQKKESTDA